MNSPTLTLPNTHNYYFYRLNPAGHNPGVNPIRMTGLSIIRANRISGKQKFRRPALRLVLIVLVAGLMQAGLSSCKKCTSCVIVTSAYTTLPEEYCGTKNEVRDFIDRYEKMAKDLPYAYSRAECTDSH